MSMSKTFSPAGMLAILGSLVLVAILGVMHNFIGIEYSLSIFYLMPIFVCVHYAGKWPGLIVSVVCGITIIIVDLNTERPDFYNIPTIVSYWNGMTSVGFFVIFSLLIASLEEALQREKGINRNLETLLTLAPFDDHGWDFKHKHSESVQPLLQEDSSDEAIKEQPRPST